MRRKMNQIIKWLEADGFEYHKHEILSPEYRKAVNALIDTQCVEPLYGWGGTIVSLSVLKHASTYQLERHDVWFNRLAGFISGVLSTVAATLLLSLIV